MKILLLSHSFYPAIGGIESISESLANAFVDEGHEVRLMTWTKEEGDKSFSYSIIRQPTVSTILKQLMWADVMFENNPCIRMSWPNVFLRRPQVTGLQTWIAQVNGTVGKQEQFKMKWLMFSHRLIACSRAVQQRTSPRAIVVGNPYNNHIFFRNAEIKKTKDFVFLGRLVSDKGATIALKAFMLFIEKHPETDATLTIIGDGEERKALEEEVKANNLGNKVQFTGSLRGKAIADALNAHRYLLVPSLWDEPFGIVALEGMACGCIPIVSDGGGLPDAVGEAGLVFKKGDANSLLACIEQLKNDAELVKKLQKAAPAHLEAHHYTNIAKRYLEVFKTVAK